MAFRLPKGFPDFLNLKGTLTQSKIAKKDDALYKTIQLLLERLAKFKILNDEKNVEIDNSINNVESELNNLADKKRSYLTADDESLYLPNSRILLAGSGIIFDDTVANQRTISSNGRCFVPMVTGAEPLEIMSDGAGNLLLIMYTP